MFNIWAASNSEIGGFFPSIYSSEGSGTINLQLDFVFSSRKSRREGDAAHGAFAQRWDPECWGCLKGQHTCMAARPAPGTAHPTQMGSIATGERGTAGKWSSAVVRAILLLPCFARIVKKKIPVMSNSVQLSMRTTNIESVTFRLKRRKDWVKDVLPEPGKNPGQAVTRLTGWRSV